MQNPSLENYLKYRNYSSEENTIIRKCLAQYIKLKMSILKQEFDTFISNLEELKTIKEKYGLDKLVVKLRTDRNKEMVNDKNDNNGCTPLFIIECL